MTFGTMEKIQTVTVGSGGAANIEFANIPATYDDLVIKASLRTTGAGASGNAWTPVIVRFNGTSTTSSRQLFGTGSGTGSDTGVNNVYSADTDNTASTFSNNEIYIPNYRGTTQKSYSADSVTENNATGSLALMAAGLTNVTVAITTISLAPDTNNFAQHSTATLYGITRVPAGAKATGGVITDDSQYWYHTFTSSGVFTPSQNLTCDYLVVAGGGGGGCEYVAGGGGAGGYLTSTGLSLTSATNYTVTIGAGGSGSNVSSGPARRGGSGSNSVFGSITATGGGGGGANTNSAGEFNGLSGGSGGGAGNGGAAGTASPSGQGFAGGEDNFNGSAGGGGGGGGAGAVGGDGSIASARGGLGGNGLSNSLSGTSVTYAGGGGGGGIGTGLATGGTGGGGNGGNNNLAPVAGTTNTGGGGGGGGGAATQADRNGQPGGSGIVIVRYAK